MLTKSNSTDHASIKENISLMFQNKLNADIEILVKRLSLVLYVFVQYIRNTF